jgi:hypothetical protein
VESVEEKKMLSSPKNKFKKLPYRIFSTVGTGVCTEREGEREGRGKGEGREGREREERGKREGREREEQEERDGGKKERM